MVEGGFTVRLARSKRNIFVPEGSTILFVLLEQGIDVPYSCGAGICGSCEVSVLSGIPDHRDFVLTDRERAAGKTMMVCCSKAKTAQLELDL